jgi:predicted PurR-regulated permease PerM
MDQSGSQQRHANNLLVIVILITQALLFLGQMSASLIKESNNTISYQKHSSSENIQTFQPLFLLFRDLYKQWPSNHSEALKYATTSISICRSLEPRISFT